MFNNNTMKGWCIMTLEQENQSELLKLADDMAAAAVSFNSHGYDSFLRARAALKTYIKEHCMQCNDVNCSCKIK